MSIIYTGIFLTDESRDKLIEWCKKEIGPLLPNEFAHHCTLAFRPTHEAALALPLGDVVRIDVVGYAADDKGQAVAVAIPLKSNNEVAHVTVSTADGVRPFYSNELLSGDSRLRNHAAFYSQLGDQLRDFQPCSLLELYGVVGAQGPSHCFTDPVSLYQAINQSQEVKS